MEIINASRNVLQCFCVAYQAERPVDLSHAAKYEMFSVPFGMFHINKTMRTENKADLVNYILESANIQTSQSIPLMDPTLHHVVDAKTYVYRVQTQGLKTFGDFLNGP